MKYKKGFGLIAVLAIVAIALVGGGGYLVYRSETQSNVTKEQVNQENLEEENQEATERSTDDTPSEEPSSEEPRATSVSTQTSAKANVGSTETEVGVNAEISEEEAFALFNEAMVNAIKNTAQVTEYLKTCTPYASSHIHPFSGKMVELRVVGMVNGKCHYTEEMPNNMMIECHYSESERLAVAQYNKEVAGASSYETSINMNIGGESTTEYTIDGRVVSNPFQDAMDRGVCTVIY